MAETKVSDPIITFKNVSKTYTLYKDDKARFKALFFKPRNAKTNKALNNVSMVINRGELLVLSVTTVQASQLCSR